MSSVTAVDTAPSSTPGPGPRHHRWRLTFGVIARVWLWFLVGCLLVTFVPMLFGWRPYIIESGSMEPRIKVGDVVLASPEQDPQKLLGRVTTFDDPDREGKVKTHRVIKINDDGTLQTKGDANQTPDSVAVSLDQVRGIGRLLVRWVGLPLIWFTTGAWLKLALFLLSLLLACLAVANDQEDEEEEDDNDPEPPDVQPPPGPSPASESATTPTQVAATKPFKLRGPLERRVLTPFTARLATRIGFVALASGVLLLPTTIAAFAATTNNGSESWTVPNWDYTTQANLLGPYLYWKLDETGATVASQTAADASGNGRTGQYNGNLVPNVSATYFTRGITGALITDTPNSAVTLNNANSCINTVSTTLINAPAAVTVIIWFKAPSTYNTGASSRASRSRGSASPRRPPAPTTACSTWTATARSGSASTTVRT